MWPLARLGLEDTGKHERRKRLCVRLYDQTAKNRPTNAKTRRLPAESPNASKCWPSPQLGARAHRIPHQSYWCGSRMSPKHHTKHAKSYSAFAGCSALARFAAGAVAASATSVCSGCAAAASADLFFPFFAMAVLCADQSPQRNDPSRACLHSPLPTPQT